MRRISVILWLFMILLLCASSLPVFAEVPQQGGGVGATTTNKVNLRAGPGTEWRLIGTIENGLAVTLDGRNERGDWVRGLAASGTLGWMSANYVSLSPDQLAALPIVTPDTPSQLTGSAPAPDTAPAAAPAANAVPSGPGIPATITNGVNVRNAPNGTAPKIGRLAYQTPVNATGRSADYNWVFVATADGSTGWVSAAFLSLAPEIIKTLPEVQASGAAAPAAAAPAPAEAASEPVPVAPVVSTSPVKGFNLGGHVLSLGPGTVSAMQRAGMTWVKKQYRINGDTGGLVSMINEAHNSGFRILVGIVGSANSVTQPGYFDQYAQIVATAAAAGADAIEVWNEQNIDREWASGSIDPARYTEMLRVSYNAIKAANPGTMVISGALAPTGYFSGCSPSGCDDNAFLAGMAAAGAANYMDCVGVHYNEGIVPPTQTSGDPRGNSGHYTRYFQGMMNTYSNAFRGARPLCFTELGYLTPEGYGPLPGGFAWASNVTVAQQAAWLASAASLAQNSGKVRLMIVWNVDFVDYGADPMAGYAMIRPGGGCPACDALGRR